MSGATGRQERERRDRKVEKQYEGNSLAANCGLEEASEGQRGMWQKW